MSSRQQRQTAPPSDQRPRYSRSHGIRGTPEVGAENNSIALHHRCRFQSAIKLPTPAAAMTYSKANPDSRIRTCTSTLSPCAAPLWVSCRRALRSSLGMVTTIRPSALTDIRLRTECVSIFRSDPPWGPYHPDHIGTATRRVRACPQGRRDDHGPSHKMAYRRRRAGERPIQRHDAGRFPLSGANPCRDRHLYRF